MQQKVKLHSQFSDLKFTAICIYSQLWSGPQPKKEIDHAGIFLPIAANNHDLNSEKTFRPYLFEKLLLRFFGSVEWVSQVCWVSQLVDKIKKTLCNLKSSY